MLKLIVSCFLYKENDFKDVKVIGEYGILFNFFLRTLRYTVSSVLFMNYNIIYGFRTSKKPINISPINQKIKKLQKYKY